MEDGQCPDRDHELRRLRARVAELEDRLACGEKDCYVSACPYSPEAEWPGILGSGLIGLFQTTQEGDILRASPGLAKILGYDSAREFTDSVGNMSLVYADPSDREAHIRDSLDHEGPISRELRWVRADGRIIWVRSDKVLVRDNEGRVLYQEGVVTDITDRRRAQEAVAESERRYRLLADNMIDVIWTADSHGKLTYASPSARDLFGYEPEEFLTSPVASLLSPMAYRILREAGDREESQPRQFEMQLHASDGSPVFTATSYTVMYDELDRPIGVIGVCRDISRRHKAEERLRAALAEHQAIFENSQVGVVLLRGDRVISRVNSRLAEIFGYRPEDLVGRNVEMLHLDRERYEEFDRDFYQGLSSEDRLHVEFPMRRADGTEMWCMLSGKAIQPPDLEKGVIWVVDDITERKEMERLRQDVERITRHDLKAPLGAVINFPDIIREEGPLTDEQREDLNHVQEAGYRMLRLVNLSLDLFKMERGAYELQAGPINLLELIAKARRELRTLAKSRRQTVNLRVDGQPPAEGDVFLVRGEELLCHSMLDNLLRNALEASPEGGAVRLELARAGHTAVMRMVNQGVVPREIRDRFFEKYATHGKRGGTGLGNYSARLMARTMGGEVSMETNEEVGSTAITVRLPLA
ncbi:PAS domain S-box protein [Desulfohalovibrio reitneri]|uniref:PAS domain S-box protein n=1 Tax=Desulfohalovibrio reitneri TaxID=1307759 RepID=UPI000692402D|nr:PAS domain S-box protein [Desulfohalovibrio reitneri]